MEVPLHVRVLDWSSSMLINFRPVVSHAMLPVHLGTANGFSIYFGL